MNFEYGRHLHANAIRSQISQVENDGVKPEARTTITPGNEPQCDVVFIRKCQGLRGTIERSLLLLASYTQCTLLSRRTFLSGCDTWLYIENNIITTVNTYEKYFD